MTTLDEIALRHGTDKASSGHNYVKRYETYFERLRGQHLTILELGWGGHEDPAQGGASARTWRDYFPYATVVVVDIEPKVNDNPNIHFHQGSQADPEFLAGLHEFYGDFDIIIDDASHLSSLTIRSWEILYPMLSRGGTYVVEDTHMAYHDFWYGADEANPDPDQPCSNGRPTAMQFFKRLADEVNHKGRGDWDLFPERYSLGYRLDWIHFYFNILFVGKA